MPDLQFLGAEHAQRVLAFELENRAYFALSISDRGDEYFAHFADRYGELLADQATGVGASYVLIADDSSVVGRVNLFRLVDGAADLGYRVAERVAGHGVATASVRDVCRLAAERHGLRLLRAAVSRGNVASQKVLSRAGFVATGPAGPADLGGKEGTWYQRDVTDLTDSSGHGA